MSGRGALQHGYAGPGGSGAQPAQAQDADLPQVRQRDVGACACELGSQLPVLGARQELASVRPRDVNACASDVGLVVDRAFASCKLGSSSSHAYLPRVYQGADQ